MKTMSKLPWIFHHIELHDAVRNCLYSNVCFVLLSEHEGCNFKEFMKTLAHFRLCSKNGHNPLNNEEEKLKCMWKYYVESFAIILSSDLKGSTLFANVTLSTTC